MTTFYRFPSNMSFPAESLREGVNVSVIGDYYEPEPEWTEEDPRPEDFEPTYIGYLVNTSAPIEEWAAFEVTPAEPMRIFG
jgi:hypothetical protein